MLTAESSTYLVDRDSRELPHRLPTAALDAIAEGGVFPFCVLAEGRVESATPALEVILGGGAAAVGFSVVSRVVEEDRARVSAVLDRPPSDPVVRVSFRVMHPTRGVREVLLEAQPIQGGQRLLGLFHDRTEQARTEQQLSSLAFLDALTGLPNRAQFHDRLAKVCAESRREERAFALLAIDLDGFKAVNDTHGHDAGDALLAAVGGRLTGCARHTDLVARLGGDEFSILLPRLREPEDAAIVAGRIVRTLQESFDLDGIVCRIGASVGVAVFPSHGHDVEQLLAASDTAMYEAKHAGKNCYRFGELPRTATTSIPFVRWSETHDTGHRAIDAQHRALAGYINELGAHMKTGADIATVKRVFNMLFKATAKHFAYEELLMDDDEHAVVHRSVHRRLLDDLESLSVSLDDRSVVLTMRFLQQWLFRHVDAEDKVLVERLRHASQASAD